MLLGQLGVSACRDPGRDSGPRGLVLATSWPVPPCAAGVPARVGRILPSWGAAGAAS